MKHRPATREDLQRWFGHVPASMRALVMEHEGEVVGVAGVALMADHLQAFAAESDKVRSHKMAKGRMAMDFAKLLASVNGPVFALCSQTEPTAPGLLAHLGFRPHSERMWRYG
jgi:hypothetical protein